MLRSLQHQDLKQIEGRYTRKGRDRNTSCTAGSRGGGFPSRSRPHSASRESEWDYDHLVQIRRIQRKPQRPIPPRYRRPGNSLIIAFSWGPEIITHSHLHQRQKSRELDSATQLYKNWDSWMMLGFMCCSKSWRFLGEKATFMYFLFRWWISALRVLNRVGSTR